MQIIKLLEIKINEGKNILQNISLMRRISGPAINVAYYMPEDIEKCSLSTSIRKRSSPS